MGVVQLSGHFIQERVKFSVVLDAVHLNAVTLANLFPVDAVEFGIVVAVVNTFPNIFKHFLTIFRGERLGRIRTG
jgi:hypothetical protein